MVPDGAYLLFRTDLEGYWNIGVYSVSTRQWKFIVAEPYEQSDPSWSPDGRQIAFISTQGFDKRLGILELEPNSPVIREIEEQQKVISDAGFERYEHPSGVHDDLFWGLALACYAAVEFIIGLPPAGIETATDDVEMGVDADTIIEGIMQQVKWPYPY